MDNTAQGGVDSLKQKISQANLPQDVSEKLLNLLHFPGTGVELERLAN